MDRGAEGEGSTPCTTPVGLRRTSARLERLDAEVFKRPSSRNLCSSISTSKFFNPSPSCLSSDDEGTLTDASIASSAGGLLETRKLFAKEPRKRSLKSAGAEGSSSDAPSVKSSKSASGKRSRKPPRTTPHYVGLAEAQKEANRLKREALAQELEAKVAVQERQANLARTKHGYGVSLWSDYSENTVAELESLHDADMGSIVEIARKSSNMKGTLQKALRDHATNAKRLMASMATRLATEEVQRLQATVNRLEEEKLQQHRRIEVLEAKIAKLESVTPLRQAEVEVMDVMPAMNIVEESATSLRGVLEEMLLKHAAETKVFVRSCFAGIEDRLNPPKIVRPQLAADKRKDVVAEQPAPKPVKGKGVGKKSAPKVSATSVDSEVPATYASMASTAAPAKRANPSLSKVQSAPNKVPRSKATTSSPHVAAMPGPSSPAASADSMLPATTAAREWQVVRKKKKNKKKKKAKRPTDAAPATSKPAKSTNIAVGKSARAKKAPKIVPPKSAAVVLTITPEAAEKGVSYEEVLTKARQSVKPRELGIEEVKCRQTQTGARLFEFSGVSRDANADLFATALRAAVVGLAVVGRPIKTTSLVISELDDSVTRDEVVEVVAAAGSCSRETVKAAEVRSGRRGIGEIRLSCPVAAAQAVLKKGRLSIGFSSGVVQALEAQPMHCFKCFLLGHTRARCPSAEDRSTLCRRCGKADHKASACKGKPHCVVCAASGKAADHTMGGAKCNPPAKRGIAQAQTRPVKATTVNPVAEGTQTMEE